MPSLRKLTKYREIKGKKYYARGEIGFHIKEEKDGVFDVYLVIVNNPHKNEWENYYDIKLSNWKDFAIWHITNYEQHRWVKLSIRDLQITKISDNNVNDKLFLLSYCSYKNKDGFILILEGENVSESYFDIEYDIVNLTNDLYDDTLFEKEVKLEVKTKDVIFTLIIRVEDYLYKID
jgi:hypothetical protein